MDLGRRDQFGGGGGEEERENMSTLQDKANLL